MHVTNCICTEMAACMDICMWGVSLCIYVFTHLHSIYMCNQRWIRGKDNQLASIAYNLSLCMGCLKIAHACLWYLPCICHSVDTWRLRGHMAYISDPDGLETMGGNLFHSETNVSRGKMYHWKFPVLHFREGHLLWYCVQLNCYGHLLIIILTTLHSSTV